MTELSALGLDGGPRRGAPRRHRRRAGWRGSTAAGCGCSPPTASGRRCPVPALRDESGLARSGGRGLGGPAGRARGRRPAAAQCVHPHRRRPVLGGAGGRGQPGRVLVVDALVGPRRLRRVERYLAVAWSSGATPVVVLTKADLCDDVGAAVAMVAEDALGVDVLAGELGRPARGWTRSRALLGPGRTAAMVGPSGVGKSSLANALAGRAGRRHPGDPRGRPRPAHHHRPRAARPARRRAARGHAGHARARPLRGPRGHRRRVRRRRGAGRPLPLPRLRAPHRARLRGRRGDRRRPPGPGRLSAGASWRPRRTASGCASTPAPARAEKRPGSAASPGADRDQPNRPR